MFSTRRIIFRCAEILRSLGNAKVRANRSRAPEGISFALPLIREGTGGPEGLLGLKGQKKAKENLRGIIYLQRQDSGQPLWT